MATVESGEKSAAARDEVRASNDRLALRSAVWKLRGFPMVCECSDPACAQMFFVSAAEYVQARSTGRALIGHVVAEHAHPPNGP